MAASGFEGFEKRLELNFFGDDPAVTPLGLRLLDFGSLEQILRAVQCTVVSAVGNDFFDAYVLSESSLFVYPTKIIIKTCGTTQLLKSIRPFVRHARHLGLTCCGCRYTRGSFIFPESQPFPHTSFEDEVVYIEENLPNSLCYRKSTVMQSKLPSQAWHVFTASDETQAAVNYSPDLTYTVEVCMTELDRSLARKFSLRPGGCGDGDISGKEMTELTGIDEIIHGSVVCDFAFDPCGYSMNGIYGEQYSTIHVTPEDGFSYASFECVGSVYEDGVDLAEILRKAVQVFRPAKVSVSTTGAGKKIWSRVAQALEPLGLKRRSSVKDDFPAAGSIVFQTFTVRRQ